MTTTPDQIQYPSRDARLYAAWRLCDAAAGWAKTQEDKKALRALESGIKDLACVPFAICRTGRALLSSLLESDNDACTYVLRCFVEEVQDELRLLQAEEA